LKLIYTCFLNGQPEVETTVSIEKEISLSMTNDLQKTKHWQGNKVEGLLMNPDGAGYFDDTAKQLGISFYEDTGKWDVERNTGEVLARRRSLEKSYGLLAFSGPLGYGNNGWINF
jgi:hypothetical protein